MKPHQTFAITSPPVAGGQVGLQDVPQDWLAVVHPSMPVWRHTLILTGKLNSDSTPELDEEIECLYQEGVTSVVLDLRRLDAIQLAAIPGIASLSSVYKLRGLDVAVIGGSALVHCTLADADAVEVLAREPHERIVSRNFSRSTNGAFFARSTRIIKAL